MAAILGGLLIAVAAAATYTDLRTRRIPNALTFGAAGLALAIRLATGGWPALQAGLAGWALGAGLLLVPFILGWMGAGDLKLLATFGAIIGPSLVLQAAVLACLVAGVMALFCLIREGQLRSAARWLLLALSQPLAEGGLAQRRMPFGPALAIGATATLVIARMVA